MKQKGIIDGFAGRRFNIVTKGGKKTGTAEYQKQVPESSKRWEVLKKKLVKDLLNGVYAPDEPLPMLKELEEKYGASYHPLKRALEELCKESALRHYKKSYRFDRLVPTGSYSRIVLFCLGDFVEQITIGRLRGQEFLQEVVRECSRRRIMLDIAIHSVKDGEF